MQIAGTMRALAIALVAALAPPALAAGDCVTKSWRMLAPEPQEFASVETPGLPANIHAYRFGAPAGQFSKLFIFFLDGGECYVRAVVAGTYEMTTSFAREKGSIGPEDRLYHLDLYDGDSHQTLGFSKVAYTFEQVRDAAIKHLK